MRSSKIRLRAARKRINDSFRYAQHELFELPCYRGTSFRVKASTATHLILKS